MKVAAALCSPNKDLPSVFFPDGRVPCPSQAASLRHMCVATRGNKNQVYKENHDPHVACVLLPSSTRDAETTRSLVARGRGRQLRVTDAPAITQKHLFKQLHPRHGFEKTEEGSQEQLGSDRAPTDDVLVARFEERKAASQPPPPTSLSCYH